MFTHSNCHLAISDHAARMAGVAVRGTTPGPEPGYGQRELEGAPVAQAEYGRHYELVWDLAGCGGSVVEQVKVLVLHEPWARLERHLELRATGGRPAQPAHCVQGAMAVAFQAAYQALCVAAGHGPLPVFLPEWRALDLMRSAMGDAPFGAVMLLGPERILARIVDTKAQGLPWPAPRDTKERVLARVVERYQSSLAGLPGLDRGDLVHQALEILSTEPAWLPGSTAALQVPAVEAA